VFSFSARPNEEEKFNWAWFMQIFDDAVAQAMHSLTAEELEKVKRKMIADLVYVNDNPEDAAYWVGYSLAVGLTLDEVENFVEGIQGVSLDGVKKAYDQLMAAPRVDGLLKPQETAEAAQ